MLRKTVKIKLDIKVEELLPTFQAYTSAFNFICQLGYSKKNYNVIDLQKLSYHNVRNNFKLPSQLTISVTHKSQEALKAILSTKGKIAIKRSKAKVKDEVRRNAEAKCPESKLCSIRLDHNRAYSLFLERSEVSILTLEGRKKFPLIIPIYYENLFKTWRYTSADLCIYKNQVYIHIVFEKEITDSPSSGNLIGIDRGLNNIAVSSDNKFYGGRQVKQKVRKFQKLRKRLQEKGTRSAKRHLKKLSGKERRFRADVNHTISKRIISNCKVGDKIVLENLTNIRNSKKGNNVKELRTFINSWSYFQLEQYLIYKGKEKGIEIVYVSPRYTSQRCNKCGNIDKKNRKSQSQFCCKKCNFKLNADLNAARNIRDKFESPKNLDSNGYLDMVSVNKPSEIVLRQSPDVSIEILDTSPDHATHGRG